MEKLLGTLVRTLDRLWSLASATADRVELSQYIPDGLEDLGTGNLSIDDLIAKIAEKRKRPIEVVAMPLPPRLYGARLAGPTKDFIVFEANTARIHQDHIKAHELAHIIAGHPIAVITDETSLDAGISGLLMRGDRDGSWQEREAEALAHAIEDEIRRRRWLHLLSGTLATSPVWNKLVYGLGLDK